MLSKFIFGSINTFEKDGWLCFSRFTDKQGEWLEQNGFPRDRYSTSGMRLEFITHGGLLSFDFCAEQSTNGKAQIFGLEITSNGIPIYHTYKEELPLTDKVEVQIPESNDLVHIVVYFPLRAIFKIKNVIIPQDAQPVRKETKILTLGDSITAGAVCRHSNHCYVNMLSDKLNAELVNQGVGGARFFPDFLEELPFVPDIVTIAYGVNDYSGDMLFSDSAELFFEKVYNLYKDKKIIVLLPIWYGGEENNTKKNTFDQGREYIKDLAEKYPNFTVINCKNFIPHLPEFYWDKEMVHPNDLGFLYYGSNLCSKLAEII